VQTFDFYLEDDRSALPILSFVKVLDLEAARNDAAHLLAQSPHHRAVAICEGRQRLCVVSRQDR
jgi:hypothetical protein